MPPPSPSSQHFDSPDQIPIGVHQGIQPQGQQGKKYHNRHAVTVAEQVVAAEVVVDIVSEVNSGEVD